MSNPLLRLIWKEPMPATEKLVAVYLADRADDQHMAWPSLPTIAQDTGLARSTVAKAVANLKTWGFLTATRRTDTSNLYRVQIGKAPGPRPAKGPRPGAGPPPSGSRTLSLNEAPNGVLSARAREMLSGWPELPSGRVLVDWLTMRNRRKAPVTETVISRMGPKLAVAATLGWTVDDVLGECSERGWTGFDVGWVEPRNVKPQPVRAGAGVTPPHGRHDYAHQRRPSNGGGAIDRVLANAARRAEEAAAAFGAGPDRGDDDLGVRDEVDHDPRG